MRSPLARRSSCCSRSVGSRQDRDYAWLIAEAAVAAAALFIAWREQERLRLLPLLILAAGYHLALVWSHMAADIPVDFDISIFTSQGQSLLDGDYPRSEYPTGAVLALRARDVARRRLGADAERAADDPVPARRRRRRLVAPDAAGARGSRRSSRSGRSTSTRGSSSSTSSRPRCSPSGSRSPTASGSASRASCSASARR